MNLKARIEIVPLVRSKPHCITICRQIELAELQSCVDLQCSYNEQARQVNISQNAIEQLPQLPDRMQALIARHCRLRTIEKVAGSQLLIVNLSGNKLTALPRFESKVLHTLLLSDNHIQILDRTLLTYPLRRLQLARNKLRTFFVRVLKMPYCIDLEILQFIALAKLKLPADSYQSIEDLLEQELSPSNVGRLEQMMRKAIDLQYTIMLRYLLGVSPTTHQQQEEWLAYAKTSNKSQSLKELIEGLQITEGYTAQRIEYLNPRLFRAELLQEELAPNFEHLFRALVTTNKHEPTKSVQFLRFLYSHVATQFHTQRELQMVFQCGSLLTARQLIAHEKQNLHEYGSFIVNNLLSALLDFDDPQLLYECMAVAEFQEGLFTHRNLRGPLGQVDPTCKLHRHLVRERRKRLKAQLDRKTLRFKQYETSANSCAVQGPMLSATKHTSQPDYMREYEQVNTVPIRLKFQSSSEASCRTTQSLSSRIFEQENHPQVHQSPVPLCKQISDRLKKSAVQPPRSMSSLAVALLSKTATK